MKWIKSLISLKIVASSVPTVLALDNGDTITNPYDIANASNNYFASIAEATKKHKIFRQTFFRLSVKWSSSKIFLENTDQGQIVNTISSINSNKTSGPNSMPYRIFPPNM